MFMYSLWLNQVNSVRYQNLICELSWFSHKELKFPCNLFFFFFSFFNSLVSRGYKTPPSDLQSLMSLTRTSGNSNADFDNNFIPCFNAPPDSEQLNKDWGFARSRDAKTIWLNWDSLTRVILSPKLLIKCSRKFHNMFDPRYNFRDLDNFQRRCT